LTWFMLLKQEKGTSEEVPFLRLIGLAPAVDLRSTR